MKKAIIATMFAMTSVMGLAAPAMAAERTPADARPLEFSQEVLRHASTATEFASDSAGVSTAAVERANITAAGFEATSIQPGTRMPQVISSCRNPGATCTLDRSVTATATISGGAGISFEVLNANLGGSYSKSVTLGVSCTSPTLGQGQLYNAYLQGTFVIFTYNGTSGTAFLPTGIDCRVQAG
ncbi:hypothetical protein [Clavibacter michiganensis]|uniref:hypothetical protein n=1 Tax=Clavibacter michiganensis TaxID=28447 RepID=UPI0005B9BDC3|nr:hypothetical protein [Clavibacter michiganensis]